MRACVLGCVLVTALGVSGAAAQLNVYLVFDRTEVIVGETVEATLVATSNLGPGSYFAALATDLLASDPSLGLASTMSGLDWAMPALPLEVGTPDGASLLGLNANQHGLLGPVDTSDPLVIGQFTITALAPGELTYSSRRAFGAVASFHFAGPPGPWGAPSWTCELSPPETITIRPVPAPASVGLGLAMISLATRRRSRA